MIKSHNKASTKLTHGSVVFVDNDDDDDDDDDDKNHRIIIYTLTHLKIFRFETCLFRRHGHTAQQLLSFLRGCRKLSADFCLDKSAE